MSYLTVALILGTSVPKGSKMAITAEMNVIARNFFLGGRFTGSEPEIKTNWHVDNHFLTLSTHWSYQFDDDLLLRCAFETFGTGVPKISASVIRKIFSATVKEPVTRWNVRK